LYVFNCYTQYGYGKGKQIDYDALRQCLKRTKVLVEQLRAKTGTASLQKTVLRHTFGVSGKVEIRSPRIGCGLAGGDWETVRTIFEEVLPEVIVFHKRPPTPTT